MYQFLIFETQATVEMSFAVRNW